MATRAKTNKQQPTTAAPNFETSIQRLAEIVEHLESGELPLEESLALFEEGIQLARSSQRTLDSAEKRVEQLLGYDDGGDPIVEQLPGGDDEAEQ